MSEEYHEYVCLSCGERYSNNPDDEDFYEYFDDSFFVYGDEFWHIEGEEGRLCYSCYESLTGEPPVKIIGYNAGEKYEINFDGDYVCQDVGFFIEENFGEDYVSSLDPQEQEDDKNYPYRAIRGIVQEWVNDILKHTSYHRLDGWRGYYETDDRTELVKNVQEMTHLWGDETGEFNKRFADLFAKGLKAEKIPFFVVIYRTSNIFSILSSHFVPNEYFDRAKLLAEKIARVLKEYPYGDPRSKLLNANEKEFREQLASLSPLQFLAVLDKLSKVIPSTIEEKENEEDDEQ